MIHPRKLSFCSGFYYLLLLLLLLLVSLLLFELYRYDDEDVPTTNRNIGLLIIGTSAFQNNNYNHHHYRSIPTVGRCTIPYNDDFYSNNNNNKQRSSRINNIIVTQSSSQLQIQQCSGRKTSSHYNKHRNNVLLSTINPTLDSNVAYPSSVDNNNNNNNNNQQYRVVVAQLIDRALLLHLQCRTGNNNNEDDHHRTNHDITLFDNAIQSLTQFYPSEFESDKSTQRRIALLFDRIMLLYQKCTSRANVLIVLSDQLSIIIQFLSTIIYPSLPSDATTTTSDGSTANTVIFIKDFNKWYYGINQLLEQYHTLVSLLLITTNNPISDRIGTTDTSTISIATIEEQITKFETLVFGDITSVLISFQSGSDSSSFRSSPSNTEGAASSSSSRTLTTTSTVSNTTFGSSSLDRQQQDQSSTLFQFFPTFLISTVLVVIIGFVSLFLLDDGSSIITNPIFIPSNDNNDPITTVIRQLQTINQQDNTIKSVTTTNDEEGNDRFKSSDTTDEISMSATDLTDTKNENRK